MSVMWKYLDKRNATVQALEDFDGMQFIIENTPDEIRMTQNAMVGIGSPNMDGLPHAHNPKAGEDRLLNALEKIDILRERFRQAEEYMAWFKPAWEKLDEEERFVLDAFFRSNGYGADAASLVCEKYDIEHSSAYRKKNRALDHLQLLLYGRM